MSARAANEPVIIAWRIPYPAIGSWKPPASPTLNAPDDATAFSIGFASKYPPPMIADILLLVPTNSRTQSRRTAFSTLCRRLSGSMSPHETEYREWAVGPGAIAKYAPGATALSRYAY